jgi:hypothetical protein
MARGFYKRRNGLLAGLGVDVALAAPFPAAQYEKAPTAPPGLATGTFAAVGIPACCATVATVTVWRPVAQAAAAISKRSGTICYYRSSYNSEMSPSSRVRRHRHAGIGRATWSAPRPPRPLMAPRYDHPRGGLLVSPGVAVAATAPQPAATRENPLAGLPAAAAWVCCRQAIVAERGPPRGRTPTAETDEECDISLL